MVDERKFLILDDVVYSSQFTTLALITSVIVKYHDNPEEFTDEDIPNLLIAKSYFERVMEDDNVFAKNTLLNIALTRPEFDYLTVPKDYQMWLLSKFHEMNELPVRVSPIINIVGSPEVIIVYDNDNPIENLIINKLGIMGRLKKENVMTLVDLKKELNNGMSKYTNKHSRPSIFTANQDIIKTFQDEYSIIIPKIYRWISKSTVVGYIENWVLEDAQYIKEDKKK